MAEQVTLNIKTRVIKKIKLKACSSKKSRVMLKVHKYVFYDPGVIINIQKS